MVFSAIRGENAERAGSELPGGEFTRLDANDDGFVNAADPVFILNYLFIQPVVAPTCLDSADANDDSGVNIADAIYGLGYLFIGGAAPPAPFPGCGSDPTTDSITCVQYQNCP